MAARLHFLHFLRSREQRGASAVEFALVVTPLLILFFGMVQYGMYFYSAQVGFARGERGRATALCR